MLDFRPITLQDKELVDSYMYRFGEGSCQHSFTAMYCMQSKYGDLIAESDGYLFTLRAGACSEGEWNCLFPMGDRTDKVALGSALEKLLLSARERGKRLVFKTLTVEADTLLQELMPGRFVSEGARDWYEYIYTRERLGELYGHEMASKRHEISTFFSTFKDRCEIRRLEKSDIPEVLRFQQQWLDSRLHGEEDVQLECENLAIHSGLDAFDKLGLSGITVFIDGELRGYAYGAALCADSYDVLIEKGDRSCPGIYQVLNRELVRICCSDYSYINREEDVGVEGLRKAKLSYKPDILLEKRIASEVTGI